MEMDTKVWIRVRTLLGKGQIKEGIIDIFVQGEKRGWIRAKSVHGKRQRTG